MKELKCLPKHIPGKPMLLVDPKTGTPFNRTTCIHCGLWLGDKLKREKKK